MKVAVAKQIFDSAKLIGGSGVDAPKFLPMYRGRGAAVAADPWVLRAAMAAEGFDYDSPEFRTESYGYDIAIY